MRKNILKQSVIAGLLLTVSLSQGAAETASGNNVNWAIQPQYEKVKEFSAGLAAFKQGDSWGLINKEGKVVIKPGDIRIISSSGNVTSVYIKSFFKGEKIALIDKDGKLVNERFFDYNSDQYYYDDDRHFCEGMLAVRDKDRWGFVNDEGKVVVEPQYDIVWDYTEGAAVVQKKTRNSIIDKEGKFIRDGSDINIMGSFYEGLARFTRNSKWGFINTKGEEVIKAEFYYANDFNRGLAVVQVDKKYGFIDREGKFIVPLECEEASWYDLSFKKNGKTGYITKDMNGNFIVVYDSKHKIDLNYQFYDGLAQFESDGKYGFINREKKVIVEPKFNSVGDFSEGLARFEMDFKFGFINKEGKVVIEPKDMLPGNFSEGLTKVTKGNKVGYMDKEGRIVVDLQFEDGGDFSEGFAAVKKDGKWGFIKTPLSTAVQIKSLEKSGQLIGTIKTVAGREILVAGKNIAETVYIGDKLCMYSGDNIIILTSSFPMQTLTKCTLVSGNRSDIKPGMKVYKYKNAPKEKKKDKK